jgi:pimeloyl-ACP methyl ester carboxylesterase
MRYALLGRFETPQLRHMLESAIASIHPMVLAARARAILDVNVEAQLQACTVPMLYLAATEDRLVSPRSIVHIQRLRPQIEVKALVGPHLLLQVAPIQAAQLIIDFATFCGEENDSGRRKIRN